MATQRIKLDIPTTARVSERLRLMAADEARRLLESASLLDNIEGARWLWLSRKSDPVELMECCVVIEPDQTMKIVREEQARGPVPEPTFTSWATEQLNEAREYGHDGRAERFGLVLGALAEGRPDLALAFVPDCDGATARRLAR